MALASTMTGLPPVRMRYPSLGTLLLQDLTPNSRYDPKFHPNCIHTVRTNERLIFKKRFVRSLRRKLKSTVAKGKTAMVIKSQSLN
jgi:hypothetical protein